MSGGDPGRLAALLQVCREAVDEIVVALDDRIDPGRAAAAVELADCVVRVPYAPPPERMLPWLYAQCSGDWILKLDDDEVPSTTLLESLRAAADPSVTHVWFPRRWLFGSVDTYLDAAPWVPDFQLRLSVNDSRFVRFPGVLHIPIEVVGPARYVDAPIYHLEALRPRAEREQKARDYERERPGLRVGGLAFNHAFYLPELSDAPLAPTRAEDRTLIEAVVGAPTPPAGEPPDLRHATRDEIDALWPRRQSDLTADLTVRTAPERLESGEPAQIELALVNRGSSTILPRAVQIGSRWDGAAVGMWTALPAPVGPGGTAVIVAAVVAPAEPGEHTVELDLVHDGVRWLGAPVELRVQVVRRRRVGILVREATRAYALPLAVEVVRTAPALEPVLVGAADGGGYATIAGPEARVTEGLAAGRRKLRSFALAARRVRVLRREVGVLPVDALVLPALDATTLLERWTDLAAARLAADRGAPILLPPPPPARGFLDRLLIRRLLRTSGVQVGGEDDLADFLERL
jgi:hypothetical protein